jgi:geranylgeranylglycerol-phosphate geranylgeranyltransferase
MASAAVIVGAHLSRSPMIWPPALAGAGSALAAAAGANALNDALDKEIDAVNRPERPVPSGRVSVRGAFAVSACAFVASLALAAIVSPAALWLAAGWAVLTALYTKTLKGVPLVGNVAVAAVASTPFLMGGLTQDRYLPALIPTALALLVHLAREIVKDVEDMEGDRTAGVTTLAVRSGAQASARVVRAILVALMGLAAVPFAIGLYGWGYAVVVAVMDIIVIVAIVALSREPDVAGAFRASAALKLVMALGLAAFVAGRL